MKIVAVTKELSTSHPVDAVGKLATTTPTSFCGASFISTLSIKQSGPYPEAKLNLICKDVPKGDKLNLPEEINVPGEPVVAPSLDSKSVAVLYQI